MELVGARITILDAIVKQLIGSSGIITACSLNCFYVALDGIDQNKEDDEKEEDYSAVTAVDAIKIHKRKVDIVSCDIKVADAGSASSIVGNNNSNNNTHNNNNNNIVNSNRSDTECLHDHDDDSNNNNNKKKKKKRQPTQPMKATQLVRAHVVIGVLLPVLVRGKRTHSSSNSGSSCDTTTTAAASTSSSSTAGNSGGRDDDPLTEDVQVAVLYGKRFMPQAL